MGTGKVARFIVYGSFVTNKVAPNDVDVFLLMRNDFDVDDVVGEAAIVFDHSAADAYFGASVFWVRELAALGGPQAAVEDWQLKRDGTRRGLIEITGE